jgi:hypothetical protein
MKCLTWSTFVIFFNVLFRLHLGFLFSVYVCRSCGLDGSYYFYVFFNVSQTVALEQHWCWQRTPVTGIRVFYPALLYSFLKVLPSVTISAISSKNLTGVEMNLFTLLVVMFFHYGYILQSRSQWHNRYCTADSYETSFLSRTISFNIHHIWKRFNAHCIYRHRLSFLWGSSYIGQEDELGKACSTNGGEEECI